MITISLPEEEEEGTKRVGSRAPRWSRDKRPVNSVECGSAACMLLRSIIARFVNSWRTIKRDESDGGLPMSAASISKKAGV